MSTKKNLNKIFGFVCAAFLAIGTVFSSVPVLAASSGEYSTEGATWEKQGENTYTAKKDGKTIATVTKNGNVWTYDFYVVDPDAQYFVYEKMADTLTDYTSSGTDGENTNAATADDPGIITAGSGTKGYTITNSKNGYVAPTDPEYGSLSITKQVEGATVDANRKFTFTVTLSSDVEEIKKKISGSKVFDGVAFVDGAATISLTSGETKTIGDIPADAEYTVVESTEKDFSSTVTNGTGLIRGNETVAVTCVNTANENRPSEETVTFNIAKVLDTNGDVGDKEFTFNVALAGLNPSQKYQLSSGQTYTSDSEGNADITVTLKGGESVGVMDIPVGSTYLVTENGGEYTSSYKVSDANGLGLIAQSANYTSEQDTPLSTATETADKGEDITITFTNKITKYCDILLTKESVDANGNAMDDDAQYTIDIELSNLDPGDVITTSSGTLVADNDGIAEGGVYISAGDTITIIDVPVGAKYRFTEEKNNKIASYTITDANNKGKIVKDADANTTSKTELSTQTETVDDDEAVTVAFKNTKMKAAKLKVEKYENTEAKAKLGGAEFEIYYENGTPVNYTTDANGNESNLIVINANGDSDILESDLFVTGNYYLKETKAPEGFGLSGENLAFSISDSDLGGTVVLKVYDDKIVTMPQTGSNSMLYVISLAGALIIIGTIATVCSRKKQRV